MIQVPVTVTGHCLITDDSGHIHLNQTNSIHHTNVSRIIGRALAHEPNCGIYRIAFGNGGTFYTNESTLEYKPVRNSNWGDKLYNEVYSELVETGTEYDVMSTDGTTSGCGCVNIEQERISQVIITCKLSDELFNQLDSDTEFSDTYFIIDEIGLFTKGLNTGVENKPCEGELEQERMLTHLIFSPILKSRNRIFNIKYTLTIYIPRTTDSTIEIIEKPDDSLPTIVQLPPTKKTYVELRGTVGKNRLDNAKFEVYFGNQIITPIFDKHNNWYCTIKNLTPNIYVTYAKRTDHIGNEYYSTISDVIVEA